ncbi:N-acetylglucosaminyldiphosphoundecaprenol N-acetyl-beta-D-mannosaminyltransferase [Modestobacter sp. DSM 44400]|uniref:WecB/TagA/CpsF family glycosyltransferase n=1 Tax=Modestobacter sp. DSM 44400 TaxID=1550230 RepID=UPI00089A5CDD|nr:WecB/TagA/CpsF family glycosyltransferase [Modestobacter sp. DSM 44400]SDX86464.1 N-acetylglucosaminyldiphosphoundecaprenol N-acetyl-beta-D-mannosaminyltransferase [Modestobacter sp. DSM 44400]
MVATQSEHGLGARRRDGLFLPLDPITEPEVVDRVMAALADGRGGWIATPNVDHMRRAARDPGLAATLCTADISVADGAPVVWASRLAGQPVPTRVTGADLLWSLSAAAAAAGRSVYLLGGEPGVPDRAAENLQTAFPELKVVGTCSPPRGFEHDAAQMAALREELLATAPDLVFVGLGFPKQELVICGFLKQLPAAWWLGCGAALPFAAGDLDRAPAWMRPLGLEWLFRLVHEPRRLFRRYVLEDAPFAVRLLGRALLVRLSTGI